MGSTCCAAPPKPTADAPPETRPMALDFAEGDTVEMEPLPFAMYKYGSYFGMTFTVTAVLETEEGVAYDLKNTHGSLTGVLGVHVHEPNNIVRARAECASALRHEDPTAQPNPPFVYYLTWGSFMLRMMFSHAVSRHLWTVVLFVPGHVSSESHGFMSNVKPCQVPKGLVCFSKRLSGVAFSVHPFASSGQVMRN